ncbi:MAG TPA: GGDEF domain-containing protein, partial [Acidimicrobiales bacterium]|nr:GGDEF domain-containing protein [Acidimicrobiales bacterium]
MDRRALPALLAAATGATLGWAGAALDLPVLAGLSALASMVAGGSALWMLGQLRASERREQRPGRAETVMDGSSWVGIDRETGLPDARFFELCLDNRVSAARRRLSPITVLLLELGAGRGHKVDAGTAMAFALMLRRTLRDADNIARIGPRTFAVILEDTTDNGGVWTADRLLSTIG